MSSSSGSAEAIRKVELPPGSPVKLINEVSDMEKFRVSPARARIDQVIQLLTQRVTGCEVPNEPPIDIPEIVKYVLDLLANFSDAIDQIPPVQTPQRFGNPSYRTWLDAIDERIETGNREVDFYLKNAFGSWQRIDYGTGHELNFLAFWDGICRDRNVDKVSGSNILLVFSKYFDLCRKVIRSYNLEPAGSHGVWGLDDHFHLPYILGAAQLAPLGPEDSPQPKDVLNLKYVDEYKATNLYFGAISFIYEVKKGAFFEHSPILYDVSGVKSWSKIKGGMIKMYNGEVLTKFPVVQHFYFGKLFPFEKS